tara:strand:+ start:496 stop:1125 length:630 start_codon:yes stop_codon:yes gene_type:complete
MSQIKLKHSGGNSVIIAAPDSNPASDRTLKLPSNADGTVLTTTNPKSGNILQVVQTVKQDVTSITGVAEGGSYTAITGLSATITPSSSSNKILISCNIIVSHSTTNYAANFRLFKAGSHLTGASGTASGNREAAWLNIRQTSSTGDRQTISNKYLDTAGGTSAITYQIYAKVEDQSSGKFIYINTNPTDGNEWYNGRTSSNITLMEVAA